VLLVEITGNDIGETALLAAVGAVVSFTVSIALKWLNKKTHRKQTNFNNNKKINNNGKVK
ncbi:MAG TPA: hypothetical protein VK498_15835, partial [Ferruginibacter sp.]|nr:hypothetical protein [Ferruginibacter sp.]